MKYVVRLLTVLMALALVPGTLLFSPHHASAATLPASLAGETLTSTTQTSLTGSCDSYGNGSLTYSETGVATGPYLGTFTETGTIIFTGMSQPDVSSATVTGFTANFTITSPTGTVTGTKTLAPGQLGIDAFCFSATDQGIVAPVLVTYDATITPITGGTYRDTGTASVISPLQPVRFSGINESFLTSNGVVPTAPTSKEQCKNGGYQNFIDPSTGQPFKNQGQCVSYVNHHQP